VALSCAWPISTIGVVAGQTRRDRSCPGAVAGSARRALPVVAPFHALQAFVPRHANCPSGIKAGPTLCAYRPLIFPCDGADHPQPGGVFDAAGSVPRTEHSERSQWEALMRFCDGYVSVAASWGSART
jgi:hypothetical protein